MKKITAVLLLAFSFGVFAQDEIVNIPDANFKAYLVGNSAINTNNDTEISVAEAEAFAGKVDVKEKKISNLSGIEAFVNLTELDCSYNWLKTLDISQNTVLELLNCEYNGLSKLSLSNNVALTYLNCSVNHEIEIDLTHNVLLKNLFCNDNELRTLDISKNSALIKLECYSNQLYHLDLRQNHKLNSVGCSSNQINHICITESHNTSNWSKDSHTEYSTNCKPLSFLESQDSETIKVIKAYNLHGQEVPVNTKGEVIILLYDNGVREKTYVAE